MMSAIFSFLVPRQTNNSEMTQRDLRVITLAEAMDRLADQKSIGFPFFEKFERRFRVEKAEKNSIRNYHLQGLKKIDRKLIVLNNFIDPNPEL